MSSGQLLQELKQRVDSCTTQLPSQQQNASTTESVNSEYEENITAFRSVTTEVDVIVKSACDQILAHVQRSDNPQSYRICSLGCGNGKLDKQILQQLTERCPGVKFEYVGLDSNQASLEVARSTMTDMRHAKLEYHDIEGDVEALSKYSKFDAVIVVHLMCYLKSGVSMLSNFVRLLNPAGTLFVIHCGDDDPLSKLTDVFRLDHEKGCYNLPKDEFLSYLSQVKDGGEIKDFISSDLSASFDLRKLYQNDETRDRVLNFIAHAPREKYPRDIKDLCLKYIDAAHEEMAGEMIRMNSYAIWNKK